MTRSRIYGSAIALLGAIVGTLPFLAWFRIDVPGRALRLSGVDVVGELWSLPALGAVAAAIGAVIATATPDPGGRVARLLGAGGAGCGALAAAWAAKGALGTDAIATPIGVADAPPAPLETLPVGLLAIAAAAAVAAVAFLWLREGAR